MEWKASMTKGKKQTLHISSSPSKSLPGIHIVVGRHNWVLMIAHRRFGSPPPPPFCYLHFLLYSRNNVLPPFNGPALGTSVSPVSLFRVGREENREPRSEAEFPELLSWSVQVQGIAQVSREIWDRMASLFK
jgi:hypothetical protein